MIELFALVAAAQASSLTFSRLIVQQDGGVLPAQAPEAYGPHFLDLMRSLGLEAAGAEDALFGKDEASHADFVLAGTVLGVITRAGDPAQAEVQVEWKLLDRERDAVVYSVVTRGYTTRSAPVPDVALSALDDALCRALIRPKFREALNDEAETSLVIDAPDAVRLTTSGSTASRAASSSPGHARGRDRTARGLKIAGAASLGAGALLIVPTWVVTESAPWMSDVGWGGAVTLNTTGWLLAASGGAALATGLLLHADAGPSLAIAPNGVWVTGRF